MGLGYIIPASQRPYTHTMQTIIQTLADELGVQNKQVTAAVQLLDEGSTVPFIARYRKEVTYGLDDSQLRQLEQRLGYLRELEDRRQAILRSIEEQCKLTPELRSEIMAADAKTRLEDLYLPYKPKRRTKGQIAIEAGLEPLANGLLQDPSQAPEQLAQDFLDNEKGITSIKEALDGAKYILMERFAEQADLLAELRHYSWEQGLVQSTLTAGKAEEGQKFSDYFDYQETIKQIPSHRALALFRGRNEGILQLNLLVDHDPERPRDQLNHGEHLIAQHAGIQHSGGAADPWLYEVVRWTWRVKLLTHLETELLGQLREQAEATAIQIFAANLKDLLMAAPAGPKAVLGLDPGLRTGVKVAVVDSTGKLLAHSTIYPHPPKRQWQESIAELAALCQRHQVALVSIGNGTASRETDKLVAELMQQYEQLKLQRITVSEAGASVYSASELASNEFPDLDVSIRGAVSIARRLQDPLAELVKIEPKAIGVGQYQHDVNQSQLARTLDTVIEDCVNAVGVDVNTASVPLLAKVSGLGPTLAQNIVHYRDQHGAFQERSQLKQVTRLGPKAFEQAAGFLRIMSGNNPLDASAVHPEAYPVVEQIVSVTDKQVSQLIGDSRTLSQLDPANFTSEAFGLPTVKDILQELDKPGRDPRPQFRTAAFKEGVESLSDLKPGMKLEGSVTNVTAFGAFVDIGVHQDGLVHISALANRFVKDPRDVVKTGDIVTVKVVSLDIARKRIGLSMRLEDTPESAATTAPKSPRRDKPRQARQSNAPSGNNAMAMAFAKAKKR